MKKPRFVLAALVGLLLTGCGAEGPAGTTATTVAPTAVPVLATIATPQPTDTPRPTPTPTVVPTATRPSPPVTPLALLPDGCPAQTYRNEVMGIELPVPDGLRVNEPQYRTDDYGVTLAGLGESIPFQARWLYRQTPEQLEALVEEQMAQLAGLPTERAPVLVAGNEGVMLSPVPGEVAHTAVYLPVDDRLFLLLVAGETLDDAGRCWLAGLVFFPPTHTLAELHLPADSGGPAVASPVLPAATLPADTTTWAEYHNDTYGFSFRYPDGRWTVIERLADNPHRMALAYHEMGIALRIAVARAGEDAYLQLYGGRAGDFLPREEVEFIGQPISQSALVYQGVTWAVYYNNTSPIPRGDLVFSVAVISNRDFERGAVVPEEVRAEANRIIETFGVD